MMDVRNIKQGALCLVITDTSRFIKSVIAKDLFSPMPSKSRMTMHELTILKKGDKIVFLKFEPMSSDSVVWLSWYMADCGTVVYRHPVMKPLPHGLDTDSIYTIPELQTLEV